MQLRGKKIVLGVCGSIAAYKAAHLVRLLVKEEAEVKVVMTTSASEFITPLTLATLSQHPVLTEFVKNESGEWNNHVELGLWADYMLIAPASANTIAKLAHGLCDNLLTAVYLSARCPVSIAPAMDLDMYAHSSTQQNLQQLVSYGNTIVEPGFGELASGLIGKGRMAEPEELVAHLKKQFAQSNILQGKHVIVTAGPTFEALDPVRFIGNYSSGKMGFEIALQAAALGAKVTLVSGPVHQHIQHKNIKLIKVQSAQEMYDAVLPLFSNADITILAAAVADYRPKTIATEKIKKKDNELFIELEKTVDIAFELGKIKRADQITVGFALETNNELEHAKAKIERKNFDMIVLNSLNDAGAGFGHDTNKITLITKDSHTISFPLKSKKEVAQDILESTISLFNLGHTN